ncbi:MAG: NAD-dependent epimerase/dehydratase family protein [Desulfobacteraceae bacterium]|nr:MAG: NAD-dependent epimerase/dehydratase family protein [Desulfobacteraceae bacterium]
MTMVGFFDFLRGYQFLKRTGDGGMNVLVTGTGGFIGYHLAKELKTRGCQVRGLFLPQEDAGPCAALGIEVFRGDLTVPETLHGVSEGIHTVYHLATRTLDWGTRKQFERVMVDGTKNLLIESKGKIARFIYVSSIASYGVGRDLAGANEDSPQMECGIPYCDTKILAEQAVKTFCQSNHIAYTIVRPSNVIGPGSVWVRETLDAFSRGPFPLINGGKEPGAFVYVTNLVDGMIRCAGSEQAANRIYLFRDDYPITWGEYLNTIGGWVGKKTMGNISFKTAWLLGSVCEKLLTPLGIRPPITRLAAGIMGKNNDVDASRARNELGWSTKVPQDQAMREIQEWVLQHYRVPAPRELRKNNP